MKKIIVTLAIIFFLSGCSPQKQYTLTEQQIDSLDGSTAIALWKASKAKTDECSSPAVVKAIAGMFFVRNYSDCCWQHDFDYSYGYMYGISKEQADYSLHECVDASNNPIVADVIYSFVKVFGNGFYNKGD
jgi:hypothetical protein